MDSLQQSLRTNNMKTYTFIIGSTDDFESMEDLMEYMELRAANGWEGTISDNELLEQRNLSWHEFEAPSECDKETVTLIGRGIAFSNDWSMDGTVSFLVEGALDGQGEQEMFDAGATARESMKANVQSEQQQVDPYDSSDFNNDPRHW
jgi:hypothetical protein